MDQIILAMDRERDSRRLKEVLESAGAAACLVCLSADQVRRTARKLRVATVVCGYKLGNESAEALWEDLPDTCTMLVLAGQDRLDLLQNEDIFRLPVPVSRGDLVASVRMLLQMERRRERFLHPRRSPEEQSVIDEAKRLLMDRNDMTEEQAHHFLQKKSMDSGARLVQTAQLVLESGD